MKKRKDGHLNPEELNKDIISKTFSSLPIRNKTFRLKDMLDMI